MIFSKKAFLPVALSGLLSLSLTACFHDEAEDDHDEHHHGDISLTLDAAEVISGPLTTGETGTATFTVHETEGELTGMVMFMGTAPDSVHVHSGFAGETGSPVITLAKDSVTTTMWNIPEAEAGNITLATLEAGGYYLNAHYGTKSTRVQIITADHITYKVAALAPHTTLNDDTGSATGFAGVTVNTETNDVKVHVTIDAVEDLSSAITGVHLHVHDGATPPVDSQKIILVDSDSTVASTGVENFNTNSAGETLTPADRINIANNNWYLNIHTSNNTGGEVRADFSAISNP